MKITNYLPVAIAALAITATSNANAQSSDLNVLQLTVKLEVSSDNDAGDTETKADKNGSYKGSESVLTEKFGNLQILEQLVLDNEIEEVKGWSIVLVTDDSANIWGAYATKKNEDPIDISDYFGPDVNEDPDLYSSTYSYDGKKDLWKETYQEQLLATIGLYDFVELNGAEDTDVTGVLKIEGVIEDDNDEVDTDYIKSATFTNLSGTDELEEIIVVGEASAKDGKKMTSVDFFGES